jgi:hypothetical protein
MFKESQHKRAFVIRFDNEIDLEAGHFGGRVEHVESCRATHFRSLDEFLEFLNQVLKEISVIEPHDAPSSCADKHSEDD